MPGLLKIPFHEDELLTSFVSRTAWANGRRDMRKFCSDFGIDSRHLIQGDAAAVARLGDLLGHSSADLSALAVVRTGTRSVRYRDMAFLDQVLSPSATKCCLSCLREDEQRGAEIPGIQGYARVHWALNCVQVCDRHNEPLVRFSHPKLFGSTYRDGDPIDLRSAVHDFCNLVEDWLPASTASSTPTEASFENFVVDRLAGRETHGELLDSMPLPTCIESCQLIGLASKYGQDFRWHGTGEADLHQAALLGFRILSDGHSRLTDLLDDLAASNRTSGTRPAALYGSLYSVISRRAPGKDGIKGLLDDHAAKHANARARHEHLARQQFRSAADIAREVGLLPRAVCRYLEYRGLIKAIPSSAGKMKVDVATAADAVFALKDAASFSDIDELLGCTLAQLRSIARSGLLKPLIGPIREFAKSGGDLYSRSQMVALRDTAKKVAATSKRPGELPIGRVIHTSNIDAGSALRIALSGNLTALSFDPSASLFTGLLVDGAEFEHFGSEHSACR